MDRADLAGDAAKLKAASGRRRGRLPGHGWFSCVTAPVIAPTSSSMVVSFALYVATRRPSRMTWTSSATWITWGIRVADEHHAEPAVTHPADQVQDALGLHHPQGGGGLIEQDDPVAHAAARATATACFWPPDMAPMLPA